ncbi:hypothetical protein [Streptomyces fradiae]|uniref:hypothetical protein n=1 Tax=Streptomyces fradiae TaxID=1906 RepID=UPI00351626D0
MRNLIAALLARLLGLLAPGSGPQGQAVRPRSPYGLGETLDGADTPLIRPYLVALERQEERARRRWRRLSLFLAADFGLDLDTRDIHAAGVAW